MTRINQSYPKPEIQNPNPRPETCTHKSEPEIRNSKRAAVTPQRQPRNPNLLNFPPRTRNLKPLAGWARRHCNPSLILHPEVRNPTPQPLTRHDKQQHTTKTRNQKPRRLGTLIFTSNLKLITPLRLCTSPLQPLLEAVKTLRLILLNEDLFIKFRGSIFVSKVFGFYGAVLLWRSTHPRPQHLNPKPIILQEKGFNLKLSGHRFYYKA